MHLGEDEKAWCGVAAVPLPGVPLSSWKKEKSRYCPVCEEVAHRRRVALGTAPARRLVSLLRSLTSREPARD